MTLDPRSLLSPKRKSRSSLLARIVLSFFLLSFVIVIILTVLGSTFLLTNAMKRHIDGMEALATIKVQTLNNWVGDQKMRVETLAALDAIRSPCARYCARGATPGRQAAAYQELEGLFARMKAYFPEFRTFSFHTLEGGMVFFSTDSSQEGHYHALDDVFIQGKKGPFVQNVRPSIITLLPTMTISAPVLDDAGSTIAVMAVDLSLDIMDRIVQDRTGLGKKGEAYLVDRFNLFVSAVRFGREGDPIGVHSTGIDSATQGRSGSGSYLNYAGVRVVGVYRWIPERDLALLAERPQSEVLADAWAQGVALMIAGVFMSLVLAAGVYVLAQRLTRPILAVQKAAAQVASGNLDAKAPVMTQDEIGDLAESFNLMTERVKQLYEELRSSERHFRSLIGSSMDLLFVLDAENRFLFVSPSVERIGGFAVQDLMGAELSRFVHPEDAAMLKSEIGRLCAKGNATILTTHFRIALKSGGWCMLEARVRSHLEDPDIRGIVVNARDITERKQLEDRLIQSQKMEAVGRLAGGVAHDFNNLLTVVIGYCDALAMARELSADSRDSVSEIRKAAERAASLTQQLLAYSRKQLLQPRAIDLNSLLDGMEGMLKRLIGEDVDMLRHTAADLRSVRADPHQIEQVLMNLAVNARDAMPNGGAIVFETQNAELDEEYCSHYPELAPGAYAMLAVSDTGAGMDKETKERIFDPFFTTKGIGKGTGLGLATVYGIVKQSGGHISVYSEPGKGSTFKVYLPVVAADTAPSVEARPGVGTIPGGAETILVVEDEEPLRKMIGKILAQAGYRVQAASSPEEAIPMASAMEGLDLLVTDIILPGMNGKDMADMIRGNRPGIKILYISGYTESAIGQHGILPQEIDFLQKPFSPTTFARKVREILDRG